VFIHRGLERTQAECEKPRGPQECALGKDEELPALAQQPGHVRRTGKLLRDRRLLNRDVAGPPDDSPDQRVAREPALGHEPKVSGDGRHQDDRVDITRVVRDENRSAEIAHVPDPRDTRPHAADRQRQARPPFGSPIRLVPCRTHQEIRPE